MHELVNVVTDHVDARYKHEDDCLYVLWTAHLSKIVGNNQLDTQLLYFTIRLL